MSNDLFKRNCAVLAQWYAGECKEELQGNYHGDWILANTLNPHDREYRIRPRTITVNGVEVPEPVRIAPNSGSQVWVADPYDECMCWSTNWEAVQCKTRARDRGLIHLTKEAAQQHAEAMLAPSKRAES